MNRIVLSTPQLGFVVATRAALAFGIGLLVSSRLDRDRRRALGGMLVALGALTTIPAVRFIRRSEPTIRAPDWSAKSRRPDAMKGARGESCRETGGLISRQQPRNLGRG